MHEYTTSLWSISTISLWGKSIHIQYIRHKVVADNYIKKKKMIKLTLGVYHISSTDQIR